MKVVPRAGHCSSRPSSCGHTRERTSAEGPAPRQAEPLGKQVAEAMDARAIAPHSDVLERAAALSAALGWPATTAQRVWAFGPDAVGPNLMVDATGGGGGARGGGQGRGASTSEGRDRCGVRVGLQGPRSAPRAAPPAAPPRTARWLLALTAAASLRASRSCLARSFAEHGPLSLILSQEGVLCEEPLRGVAFSILDAALDGNAVQRGGGQIIPTARRVMYAAQHLSAPRLMEPVLLVDLRGPEHTHREVQPPRPRPFSGRCLREKQQPVGGQESVGPTPPCGVFATAADERARAPGDAHGEAAARGSLSSRSSARARPPPPPPLPSGHAASLTPY